MLSVTSQGQVFVGLSGGVDSSVSAALLQQQGYDVTGVFIKIWSPEWTECTSKEDRLDAMRVCAHLGIPYKEIDLTDAYKQEVVDHLISEYKKGRTPNPDVMCNRFIKFGAFFNWALSEGADFVATGHYAKVAKSEERGVNREEKQPNTIRYSLLAGVDSTKDQSYFLWTLTQTQLAQTLFPVGGLHKRDVRELARRFKLPTAEKKDSQGLCFIGHVDIKTFLSRYIQPTQGDVLGTSGKKIGQHQGAWFLTIGERHGFIITEKGTNDIPRYIVSKDVVANTITVGTRKAGEFFKQNEVLLSDTNWISGSAPDASKEYESQIRYHGGRMSCRITEGGKKCIFLEVPDALAFGQSLVVYDGEQCLGGGILEPLSV
ncbi:MAG: tRNA 2-thiouridine(34) synthase MnmA [Candidatus Taylorbacteria bacterium RIFCSPHIGHO2_01_FULL_46_22b]|uniref:tRNA-specific 2-thiouridylase MnmA n=1 Tax=Candidatus Taylorbacteria bacterium RIFCSPHIGHO2_01_FULL_46_22b TaxID=1802301 RepID=A0A1G2M3M6_9BACT|nr:MAG: tRNA 2-thiouridine(34) synthase MnmA [Candidatus Taylorbacteria bacterium RIFCSPHIGHO2_01_FULL_46_22b]